MIVGDGDENHWLCRTSLLSDLEVKSRRVGAVNPQLLVLQTILRRAKTPATTAPMHHHILQPGSRSSSKVIGCSGTAMKGKVIGGQALRGSYCCGDGGQASRSDEVMKYSL